MKLDIENHMKPILITLISISFSYLTVSAQNEKKNLVFNDFKSNLKKDMDNKTIIETFGQPDKDIGSGIYIYIYELADSTTIIIGCTDKVLYALHSDKKGNNIYEFFNDSVSNDKRHMDTLEIKK